MTIWYNDDDGNDDDDECLTIFPMNGGVVTLNATEDIRSQDNPRTTPTLASTKPHIPTTTIHTCSNTATMVKYRNVTRTSSSIFRQYINL